MTMKVNVSWDGDDRYKAQTEAGFDVMIDRELKVGPRPMELILCGLGGCSSVDVVGILKKTRQDIDGCEVKIEAERSDEVPAVFTKINMHFVVTGRNVKESAVERAVKLSAEQYCSVAKMLGQGGVEITHSFEIVEA